MNALTQNEAVARISRDIKIAAANMTDREARYFVDTYYQMQKDRIRQGNRKFQTDESAEPSAAIQWLADQSLMMEGNVGKMLDYWSRASILGRWARENKGIGPVIAAGLLAYIDLERSPTVGHIWSYAGINPNIVWKNAEENKAMLKEILPGVALKANLSPEQTFEACKHFNRNPMNVLEHFKDEETDEQLIPTIDSLAKYFAKPPFNQNLKTLCWKIGESFNKLSVNDYENYGLFVIKRKQYETAKNDNGDYAPIAAQLLETKNWNPDTPTYKELKAGRLSKAHIHSRSKRWAVKLFLSHWHEAAYKLVLNREPPVPFALAHLGHTHYHAPLVDIEQFRISDGNKKRRV